MEPTADLLAIRCLACGHRNPDAARFCSACGEGLSETVACPSCGAAAGADQKFCNACGRALRGGAGATPSRETPAALRGGRYRVKRFLGEGSRKSVFLATDARLDRDVAIAVLKLEGLDEIGRMRAQREVQATGRLGDHPHIVTIHDVGEEDGRPHIVSEYMDGGSLESFLAGADGGRLPLETALRIADELCQALEHAHRHGVVHRDLKPANVWMTRGGVAKLGDFGLAIALDRSRLTQEGMLVGTVAYVSPEQALGQPVDARSDLYSLGAILYEMVTGRVPFVGDDVLGVISQHVNTPPVAPSWHNRDVPKPLEKLILRLLAKDPDERPADATAVREALKGIAIDRSSPGGDAEQANLLEPLTGSAFVGRRDEMRQLKNALQEALAGRGRLVMLAGEPGIGKTRTAQEIATYARLRGALVLFGRCYEGEGAPSFWPWVQAIRAYVEGRDPAALFAEMGPGAADIAQVVAEVRHRLPQLAPPPALEAEQARFRFFDSVTAFLKNAAKGRPLALLLDDLHWADRASLLLLEFLAREIGGSRLLIVGTYRDVELGPASPLAAAVANLRREPAFERIVLGGLPEPDVREFLGVLSGDQLPEPFVRAIVRETEGNPFFVMEILRHLVEERLIYRQENRWTTALAADQIGIPEGVREVIGRRLVRLGEPCRAVLTVASGVGREFDLGTLRRVAGQSADDVLERIEEAIAARVVEEVPGKARYRFAHALIRETLYDGMSAARRVRLHRRIGEVLEATYGADSEAHLAELAHHFYAAAAGGDADRAIDYATRAGERAGAVLAWEDAALQYGRAVEALAMKTPADERQRCELTLALGEAEMKSGDAGAARATFLSAAALARALAAPELLARAALGVSGFHLRGMGVRTGIVDEDLIALLTEALDALGSEDSVLRAMVMGQLALALYYTPALERRAAFCEQAVEMARRIADPATLAATLQARHSATWGPANVAERLADAAEIIAIARRTGDEELELLGRCCRYRDLLDRGDIASGDAERAACDALAEELRQPLYLWAAPVHQAGRALIDGRYEEAERLIFASYALGQRLTAISAQEAFTSQMATLRSERESLADIVPLYRMFIQRHPGMPAWRAALARVCLLSGMEDEARREYQSLAADDFRALPRDVFWLLAICLVSDVCSEVGEPRGAAVLYDLLLPFEDLYAIMGMWAGACYGSVAYYLGLLAAVMRQWPTAARHFERALERHTGIGSRPWLAHTQRAYAEMLLARGAEDDREKAFQLLNRALETAQELGMKILLERALALKLRAQGIDPADTRSSIYAVASAVHRERPDLRAHASANGAVTILFSDIEGSATLTERLGDQRWLALLQTHNAIVRDCVAAHGGVEVKAAGDGFMIVFESAHRALECARAIQSALAAHNARHGDPALRVRMGLHTGEVIKEADDFFGKNVVLAARIGAQARGGEILVSRVLKELTEGNGLRFGDTREVTLKGLAGCYELYPLVWGE